MNVYLVRRDSQKIVSTTLSKTEARRLCRKAAETHKSALMDQRPKVDFMIKESTIGSKGKILTVSIFSVGGDGYNGWVAQFWIQEHQLTGSALELLAESAE